jgi:hypothetical protein
MHTTNMLLGRLVTMLELEALIAQSGRNPLPCEHGRQQCR